MVTYDHYVLTIKGPTKRIKNKFTVKNNQETVSEYYVTIIEINNLLVQVMLLDLFISLSKINKLLHIMDKMYNKIYYHPIGPLTSPYLKPLLLDSDRPQVAQELPDTSAS